MKRFRTSKKRKKNIAYKNILFVGISFLLFIILSNVSPDFFLSYLNKLHIKEDTSITTWFLNKTFGLNNNNSQPTEAVYVKDDKKEDNKKNPILYIYNTHQTEEYYIDMLMEHDIMPSVMTASYILRENMNKKGINTMVETHDVMAYLNSQGWNYNKTYRVSRMFMEQAYIDNPSLQYFIDLHRDAISYEASSIDYLDKRYAKVLFVIGTGHDGYEKNMGLAQRISDKMNEIVPKISRGILEKGDPESNGVYNQDFNQNTILIEVGATYNRITEVKETLSVLADALESVIGNNGG